MLQRYSLVLTTCFAFLLFTGNATAQSDFPATRQAALNVSEAFGFLYGQNYSLELIESRYPDLAAQVMLAETKFSSTYSGAEEQLESTIVSMAGQDGLAKVYEQFETRVEEVIAGQLQDRESAVAFLGEVQARADGQIPSPIHEVLLAARNMSHPEREIHDGYTTLFSTTGHPKSMGLDAEVKLPLSWVASEGRRPHIVQKWRNLAGHGRSTIMLLIQEMDASLSKAEVDGLLEVEDFSTWMPEGGEYLGATRLRMDGEPAVAVDYFLTQDTGPATVVIRVRQYQMFVGDKAVSLQCQAGAGVGTGPMAFKTIDAARDSSLATFATNEQLCYLVANSIVVDQLWR